MNKFETPKVDMRAAMSDFSRAWQAAAEEAVDIAASKRKLYMAYISEGFSEAQAIELIKNM